MIVLVIGRQFECDIFFSSRIVETSALLSLLLVLSLLMYNTAGGGATTYSSTSMRVEVRRRSESSRHGAGPSNSSIVEAYSDNCFETQTRFYTVAPEHPKLGKWSQASTLKYGQHPTPVVPSHHQSLDEKAHSASTRISYRRSRPTCSSPPPVVGAHGLVGRSGMTTPTMMGASNRSIGGSSRVRQRVESRRATRPVSPLYARSESPPSSTARGRLEEFPRIDTPISGRVRVVHFFCSTGSTE